MPFFKLFSKPLAKVIDVAARRHLHQVPGAPRHNNHNVYVTGAGVRSQQRCSFKYEGLDLKVVQYPLSSLTALSYGCDYQI